jgi:hypothetical protein
MKQKHKAHIKKMYHNSNKMKQKQNTHEQTTHKKSSKNRDNKKRVVPTELE